MPLQLEHHVERECNLPKQSHVEHHQMYFHTLPSVAPRLCLLSLHAEAHMEGQLESVYKFIIV